MLKKIIWTCCYFIPITLLLDSQYSFAREVSYNKHLLSLSSSDSKLDVNAVAAALLITLIGGIYIIVERKREQ
ncbi:hypothetical protein [Macrococcus lamae]|uniref:Uncharacterized protein n=1 Tax=Macrococcus lamae TaxID=198484 RepID=A0A4R6BUG0_9STAP|nr:hypothetical protein [Macrococcus lamae]TDM11933.1 hypothetical protein ERX29_04900 [Macrococcus lamae]